MATCTQGCVSLNELQRPHNKLQGLKINPLEPVQENSTGTVLLEPNQILETAEGLKFSFKFLGGKALNQENRSTVLLHFQGKAICCRPKKRNKHFNVDNEHLIYLE